MCGFGGWLLVNKLLEKNEPVEPEHVAEPEPEPLPEPIPEPVIEPLVIIPSDPVEETEPSPIDPRSELEILYS